MKKEDRYKSDIKEDEIDLIAILKTFWEGRKTVLKTTIIFLFIGLFVAVFSEKEYTSSTTFVTQSNENKLGGNLSGLASLAGINLGGMGNDSGISPDLYPQVINSTSFQKELLQTPLTIEGEEKKVSFFTYYNEVYTPSLFSLTKKYTIGLPGIIIKAFRGNSDEALEKGNDQSIIVVSGKEEYFLKKLSDQIGLEVNDKKGFVTIHATMPEAMASAEMTLKVQELLQEYIINFKIKKSKDQLDFIEKRYKEASEKFELAQQKLANKKDRNLNISTAKANSDIQKLEDEYNLIYGVYSELAKQLEAQHIQVTEDTPVFTVLKPVSVPLEKSKPKRALIILVWVISGTLVGIGLVLGRDLWTSVKIKWEME